MISVPHRFAGFQSPYGVLDDPGLTRAQKWTALQTWRATLSHATYGPRGQADRDRLICEIDAALKQLRR
ncbi:MULTISPECIES: hypothetical protein [unclassified Roseibium]|uniref:hypothetical protein n=1 Tax=unclassified Roseibium TaxID=2629323 RepID=UPI00317BB270